MENDTISDQAEEGTGRTADMLPLVDIVEIDIIPQAEKASEDNIVSQVMLSKKPKSDVVGARRNSTENREGRPVPIYLRPSTSSCHDFCKYGKEQSFPSRERRRPIRSLIQENKQSRVDVETEFKKPTVSGLKKKQATKAEASRSPELIPQSSSSTKVVKQKAITPSKKIEITVKPTISSKSKLKLPVSKTSSSPSSPGDLAKRNSPSSISLNQLRRLSSVSKTSSSPSSPGDLAKRNSPSSISLNRLRRLSSVSKTSSSPSSPGDLAKRNSSSSISLNRLRRLSSLRKNRINLVSPSNSLVDLSGVKSRMGASNHSENSTGRRRSDGMLTKSRGLSTHVERKTARSSLGTLTPKPSSNGAAHVNLLKYQKNKKPSLENIQTKGRTSGVKEDKVSQKTLYVIEPKSTFSRHSQSSLSSSPSTSSHENEDILGSESTISEAEGLVSDQEDTETCGAGEASKDGAKWTGRQSRVVHPEDQDEAAHKVSFRRGRVVTLQTENNAPRRLRFRQGRMSDESQNGKSDSGRRSFRRKKELGTPALDKPNVVAESVILRHQDVQGKKEELGLFNEVIEETASKLVETRKSKVKALVGAFETVISLQESKPATSG